jgi:hypothetical protein
VPLNQEQIRSAVGLLAPLGRLLDLTHVALIAHHDDDDPIAEDCPICERFQEEMRALLIEWDDARAQATEHWDV